MGFKTQLLESLHHPEKLLDVALNIQKQFHGLVIKKLNSFNTLRPDKFLLETINTMPDCEAKIVLSLFIPIAKFINPRWPQSSGFTAASQAMTGRYLKSKY